MTTKDKLSIIKAIAAGGMSVTDLHPKKVLVWLKSSLTGLYKCSQLEISGYTDEQFSRYQDENPRYHYCIVQVIDSGRKPVHREQDIEE